MPECCGRGSPESLLSKFKIVTQQHINTVKSVTTTQKSNPFINSTISNNTVLTKSGYVKYIKPKQF